MAGYRPRGGQNRSNKSRETGGTDASRQTGNRPSRQPSRDRGGRSAGSRPAGGRENAPREFAPGEFFTLGEHTVGRKHYRFRYNGKVYRILEGLSQPKPPVTEPDTTAVVVETAALTETAETVSLEETVQETVTVAAEPEEELLLEEPDAKKAYEAWNRIKRPERYGA